MAMSIPVGSSLPLLIGLSIEILQPRLPQLVTTNDIDDRCLPHHPYILSVLLQQLLTLSSQ